MAADQEAPKKASTINDQAGKASASLAPAVKEHAPASNFPQTKFSVPVTLKPQATQQEVESAMSKSVPGSPPPPDKVLGSTTQAVAGQKGKNSLRVSYTPLNKSTYTSTARRSTQNSVYGPIQSVSDSVPEPQGVPSHGGGNLMADQRNQRAASPDRRSNGSMRPPLLKSGSSENKVVTGLPPRKSTLNVSRSSTSSSNPQARVSSQSPTIAPLSPTRSTSDGVRPDRLVDRPSNDNGGTGMKRSASPMQNDAKRAKPRSASTPHVMNLAQYPEVRDLVVLPGFGSHFGIPFRKSHGSITCLAPSCDKQTFGSAKAFLQHAENKNHRGFDIRKAHVPRPERNSNSVSNAAGGERSASSVNVSQYNGEFGGSRRNMHEEVRVSRAEPVKTPDLGLASKSIDLTVRAQATDKAPVETTKVARVESSKENGPGSLARPTSVSASQPISSSSLASQQFAGSKAKPAAATTAVAKTIPAPAPLQPFSSKTPDHRVSASDQSSAVDGIDNVSSQTPTTKVATASAVSTEEATRLEKLWRTHLGFESMRNQMPEPSVWAEVSKISEAKIKSFLATKDLARSRSEPLGKPSAPLLNPKIEAIRQESAKAEKKPPQAVPVTPALRARDALPSTKRPSSGSSHTSASKPDERPGQPSSSTSDRSNTKREDSQGSVNSAQEKLAGQARVKYPEGSNLKTARPLKRPRWEYILVDPNTEKSEDEKIEFTIGKTRRQERVLREGSDEPLKTVRPKRANRVPRVISRLDEDSSDDVPLRIAHGKSGEQASPSGTMSFESSDSDSEVPVPRSISPKNVRRVKQEVERKPVPARSTPLVSEKKKQPSPVSFSNSPMQNKVQESAPGPVTPMMARLEAHMMLGKAINVDDWVRAKLGSHKNVTDFLAKVAAVLPRNVSLQNSQAGDSKAESATSKPMRTIPNSDKFVPQGSPRAPQGESDAPVVKTMASPQISQSKAMDRKLCIYCGVLAEPGVSEKHLAFHERQGDVPSVDLLKRSGGRADMVGTVVHISHGKLPTLKQRAPKDAERPVYAAMPLHYGDLTDTRNAWQQTKDCAASNISPVLFCMDCVDGQPAKCRFKIIRKFVDPPSSDDNLRYVLASIHNHETDDEGSVSEVGLRGLSKTDAEFVFRRLVRPLEEFAQIEDEHEQQERILHRPRTRATGAHCDACFNLIFSGYWTCYLCGTFLCLDCFTDWQESPDSSNIPFDTCKSVAGQPMRHSKHHMIPFTSFREQELDDLLRQAQDFSPYIAASVGVGRFFKTVQHADWALPLCVEGAEKLSLSLFQKHWAIGEPLLLQGLEERTKRFWTPTKLLTLIGDQTVDVIAGNSNVLSQMRLKDFLNIPPTACLRLAVRVSSIIWQC
ncbi:hypothetical protein BCR37DRAFT_244364 [Protomyces lactucae-debilis]|uniref:Uncharacterized protein n=1 Tax=Protomyces lactucae-debilis TaxID=2754530 RepID=A0A1Y2FQP4_PROLT|nr:uncharacterized protein BCR37DRAFT_244364 [Protomyces lactucae-debilis]ORY85644.1 hypothetical protein BCR37DRAFT_244364 [Protomyces lactucae-debilis]